MMGAMIPSLGVATGHLAYSESRARLHDLYGVLKKGVVDRAIQTLDHILEERK